MPKGTIIIRGLRKELNDVEWEVKGKQVRVKTDRGVRVFELSEVELIPDVDSVDRDAPPALSSEEHARLQRRLVLLPPDGWKPVSFRQPLLAEAYKHPSLDVYLELWVGQAGDYTFAKTPGRVTNSAVGREASANLKLRYAGHQRPTYTWVEVAGKILLHGKGSVEVFGAEGKWKFEEHRLRYGALEYSVAVRMEGSVKAKDVDMAELLKRFSFLAPVTETTQRYIDQELGFYLLAPAGPWSLLARPFDRTEPLRASRGSGEASLSVEALTSGTAQGIADALVAEHKKQRSGFLKVHTVERSTRDGREVVFYHLDDYPEGRRVLHTFMGIVYRTPDERLLHFRGMSDLSDEAAAKELRLLLEGVRFLGGDLESLERDVEAAKAAADAQEAMGNKDYSSAISALDRCLDLIPDYVPAILFRANAKKADGDYTGYREDLELAQQYDPSIQGASGPEAYVEEAKQAEKSKDYAAAIRAWTTAFQKSRDAKHVKSLANALNSHWNNLKKNKGTGLDRHVRAVEGLADPVKREDEVKKVLAKIYTGAANAYKSDKNWTKAFRFASKLKSLRGPYRAQGEKLREVIKKAKDNAK